MNKIERIGGALLAIGFIYLSGMITYILIVKGDNSLLPIGLIFFGLCLLLIDVLCDIIKGEDL